MIPVLYLRGISTGDFQEALSALLGKDAPNLSPSVIAGLKADWQVEYERWQRRGRRVAKSYAGPHGRSQRMHAGADCSLVWVSLISAMLSVLLATEILVASAPFALTI
ncbi:hypothetical protein ACVME8_008784 [Bradyrhizobium diazoefficiens]